MILAGKDDRKINDASQLEVLGVLIILRTVVLRKQLNENLKFVIEFKLIRL